MKHLLLWTIILLLSLSSVYALTLEQIVQDESPVARQILISGSPVYNNAGYLTFVKSASSPYLYSNLTGGNLTINLAYNYTWAAWVMLSSYDSNSSLTMHPIYFPSTKWGLYIKPQNNRVVPFVRNSSFVEQNDIYTGMNNTWVGTWHHVLGRKNGTHINYCIDGVCGASPDAISGQTGTGTSQVRISHSAFTEAFNGSVDIIQVWENYTANNSDVLLIYANTSIEPTKLILKLTFTNSTSDLCVWGGTGDFNISNAVCNITANYNLLGNKAYWNNVTMINNGSITNYTTYMKTNYTITWY
jgi:hypothetical protein